MMFWRSSGAVALAWFGATTLGVAAAWVGLRPVLDAAVPDRAAPLSAADVRRLAAPSVAPIPAPSRPWSSASRASGGALTSPAQQASQRRSAGNSASPRTSTTIIDGWTVTTQADGTLSYLRSFKVRGGSTVIKMTPGRVSLVSATPNPDYSVKSTQNELTRLVVQFTATSKYDIVDAMWWNDQPYVQTSQVG